MIVISIKGKTLKILLISVMVAAFSIGIYNYASYKTERDNPAMTAFLALPAIKVRGGAEVEIFDIKKGRVVETLPSDAAIQKKAREYLEGITEIYGKARPIPPRGYMIKIPLERTFVLNNRWMNNGVDEVVVIVPEKEAILYLMVFDDKNRPFFFIFEGNREELMKTFDFLQ